jgi:hypothetical protein
VAIAEYLLAHDTSHCDLLMAQNWSGVADYAMLCLLATSNISQVLLLKYIKNPTPTPYVRLELRKLSIVNVILFVIQKQHHGAETRSMFRN